MDEKVLAKLDERVTEALKRKRIPELTKLNLEVMQVVLIYMRDDHPKTERMYGSYVPMAWAMVLATGTLIVAGVQGKWPEIWRALTGGKQ